MDPWLFPSSLKIPVYQNTKLLMLFLQILSVPNLTCVVIWAAVAQGSYLVVYQCANLLPQCTSAWEWSHNLE